MKISKKATTIAIVNQKGGTGKTTTCENLGIGLAMEGKKVLLVDADPQGSLTISMGWQQPDELPTTLSTLMAKAMNDQCIPPGEGVLHHAEGVDLIPANIELAGMEVALVNTMSREKMLKQVLDSARQEYDYILLDCTPSLGMLTINALAATDTALIPVQAQYLSAKGLEQLLQTINKVHRQINPKLKIEGILLTMTDNRTNYGRQIDTLIRQAYGKHIKVFGQTIPHSVRAAEISAAGKSIFVHTDFQIRYQPEQILAASGRKILTGTAFLCRRENERCLMLPSRYEKVDVEDFIREHLFFYDDAEMIYSQLFNLLCDKADDVYGGKLPVHVRCLIDECANIGQIPQLEKLVATIRSREISACLVLQTRSQLKAIYKDNADTIVGNMDSQIFLGGSEPTTLKDLAEALGKETIDSYNNSDTRGNSPSYGTNYQKLGHELMSRDELAVLDGGKCILQLRGVRPFLSDKYDLTQHPNYKLTSDANPKNALDIEKYLSHKEKIHSDDQFVLVDVDSLPPA